MIEINRATRANRATTANSEFVAFDRGAPLLARAGSQYWSLRLMIPVLVGFTLMGGSS